MALPLFNGAEAQASGTTVTPGNSGGGLDIAFSGVTIGANMTCTFDNANPMHGVNAYKIALTSTVTAITFLEWNAANSFISDLSALRGRIYFRSNVIPVSTARFIKFMNGGSTIGYLGYTSGGGQLQFRSSADAAIGSLSPALTLNTWFRIEIEITCSTNGWGIARVYSGDSATPFGDPAQFNNVSFGAANICNHVQVGITTANFTSTAGDAVFLDDIFFDAVPSFVTPYHKGRRPLPMIVGPDTDRITRMQGPK
jgi:hypothetical protein